MDTTVTFEIWQLKIEPWKNAPIGSAVNLSYSNLDRWNEAGIAPKREMYDKVYARTDTLGVFILNEYLEDLFREFNINEPEDYFGRCLSVSDVVVLNGTAYFCDSIGWKELKTF